MGRTKTSLPIGKKLFLFMGNSKPSTNKKLQHFLEGGRFLLVIQKLCKLVPRFKDISFRSFCAGKILSVSTYEKGTSRISLGGKREYF